MIFLAFVEGMLPLDILLLFFGGGGRVACFWFFLSLNTCVFFKAGGRDSIEKEKYTELDSSSSITVSVR